MGQRIEYVKATEFTPVVWTADELREQWPEDAEEFTDSHIGVMLGTSDGAGALLVGMVEQVYDKLQWALGNVIQRAKPDSPIWQ